MKLECWIVRKPDGSIWRNQKGRYLYQSSGSAKNAIVHSYLISNCYTFEKYETRGWSVKKVWHEDII